MSTERPSEEYLMLFYNTDWHHNLSPEEIQATMSKWMAWFDGLVAEGKCKGGHPLGNSGAVVSGRSATVSDGPFAEAKEAVGGYFFLTVSSMEEAISIARNCPALAHGVKVEVRPVIPNCAAMERVVLDNTSA